MFSQKHKAVDGAWALVVPTVLCLHDVDLLEMIQLASGNPNGFSLVVKKTLFKESN